VAAVLAAAATEEAGVTAGLHAGPFLDEVEPASQNVD